MKIEFYCNYLSDKITKIVFPLSPTYCYYYPDRGYIGLDLGPGGEKSVSKIRFLPRLNASEVMVGGKFQGSNQSPTEGYVDLYTINTIRHIGWNEANIKHLTPYRYIRYYGPSGSHCMVSKLEFYTPSPTGEMKITGIPFAAEPVLGDFTYPPVFQDDPDVILTFKYFFERTSLPFSVFVTTSPRECFYHQHDFLELMWIQSGSCYHYCQNQITHLFSGDCIIIPPEIEHFHFGENNLVLVNILLYPWHFPSFVRSCITDLPILENLLHLAPSYQNKNAFPVIHHLCIAEQKNLNPLVNNLIVAFTQKNDHYRLLSFSFLLQFFTRLHECLKNNTLVLSGEQNSVPRYRMVSDALTYIQQNYESIKNITEIQQALNTNYSTLAHAFKEETGISIKDYLIHIRIGQACQQMIETDDDITTIVYRVGFQSYSNFSRIFHQIVGCSPQEFRKDKKNTFR